jgi:hypothetical protein
MTYSCYIACLVSPAEVQLSFARRNFLHGNINQGVQHCALMLHNLQQFLDSHMHNTLRMNVQVHRGYMTLLRPQFRLSKVVERGSSQLRCNQYTTEP